MSKVRETLYLQLNKVEVESLFYVINGGMNRWRR